MKEFKLVKPRAKTEIIIKPDKDDDWFVYIIHIDRKSGKESHRTMIIQKDLHDYIQSFYGKGWVDFNPDEKPVKKLPGLKKTKK
jgi:hypothetical protein